MSDPRYDTPEDQEAEALVDLEPVPPAGDGPQDEEAPSE